MKRLLHWQLLVVALIFLSVPLNSGMAEEKAHLRLAIPLHAEDGPLPEGFAAKLKDFLRPDDILFVRGEEDVPLVKALDRGKVALVSPSLEGLERGLNLLLSGNVHLDFLCYSPDALGRELTPQAEKDDPPGAVEKARAIADAHGLGLILSPDTSVTLLAFGADMAAPADLFVIHLERWQLFDHEAFSNVSERTSWWVRKGSADVPLFARLSTNPPVHRKTGISDGTAAVSADDMMDRVRLLDNRVSGAAFLLYNADRGTERFIDFLKKLRLTEIGE